MQRPGRGSPAASPSRAAGVALLLAHLSVVAWLTLTPRYVPWVTAPNLTPLATIRADLAGGLWAAGHSLGGALVLLAPLGVLLPWAGGRLKASPWGSLARTVLTGALVSLAIALAQTAVPGRVPDVDVVLLNTAGVALTHLLVVVPGRVLLRRRAGSLRGRPPTISRVPLAPRADALSGSHTYL